MGKINNGLKRLGAKLKTVPKNSQGRAFARIIQFFALMIALTIFVKGASGVTMPKVTTLAAKSAEITNSIEVYGTVTSMNTQDVKMVQGLTVKKVFAQVGARVTAETKLIEFDKTAIEQTVLTQKASLIQLQQDLYTLKKSDEPDASGVENAQKAYDNANNTVNETHAEGNAAVDAAYNVLANAQAIVDAAAADRDTKKVEYDNAPIDTPEEIERKESLKLFWEEAEGNLARAITALQTVQQEAPANIAMAEKARDKNNTAAQTMLDDAARALEKANKDFEEAKVEHGFNSQKNKIAIQQKEAEIEKLNTEMEEMDKVLESAGVLLAGIEGVVTFISAAEGENTVANSHVRIATGEDGYIIECLVENAKSKQIKVGASLYISLDDYGGRAEAKIISKNAPDASGMVKVKASLPLNQQWSEGDSKKATVVLDSRTYNNTVPLTAIHSDTKGKYVLVVVEEKTILGTQTVAKRAAITVQEPQGQEIAAITFEEGLYYDSKVITSSSKPVNDGDWVRVEEK